MVINAQIALIAILFGSQILVLSFLTPLRSRQYQALMFTRYPLKEYPRLYPVPRDVMERRRALVRPLHLIVGSAAVVTLIVSLIHGADPVTLTRRMFCCLLIQILPLYISVFWTVKVAKAFHAMPPPNVRTADFRMWRLVDFVSPLWIALGVAAQVITLTCALVAYLHRREAFLMPLVCSIISGAWLVPMIYVLLGRATFTRADPYMSTADVFRFRQRRFRALFCGGAALGGFNAFNLLHQAQLIGANLDSGYQFVSFIGCSVVMQLLWFGLVSVQRRDLQTRDFSVYRADIDAQSTS
jgi:hypothetical protein